MVVVASMLDCTQSRSPPKTRKKREREIALNGEREIAV